jgi:hypothetical protein
MGVAISDPSHRCGKINNPHSILSVTGSGNEVRGDKRHNLRDPIDLQRRVLTKRAPASGTGSPKPPASLRLADAGHPPTLRDRGPSGLDRGSIASSVGRTRCRSCWRTATRSAPPTCPARIDLMMRIYAAMAQKERKLLCDRAKAAQTATWARGKALAPTGAIGPPRAWRPCCGPCVPRGGRTHCAPTAVGGGAAPCGGRHVTPGAGAFADGGSGPVAGLRCGPTIVARLLARTSSATDFVAISA